jgi:hypothetical protein
LFPKYLIGFQGEDSGGCPIEPEGVALSYTEIAVDVKGVGSEVGADLVGFGDD